MYFLIAIIAGIVSLGLTTVEKAEKTSPSLALRVLALALMGMIGTIVAAYTYSEVALIKRNEIEYYPVKWELVDGKQVPCAWDTRAVTNKTNKVEN
jgi:hypothetical protein